MFAFVSDCSLFCLALHVNVSLALCALEAATISIALHSLDGGYVFPSTGVFLCFGISHKNILFFLVRRTCKYCSILFECMNRKWAVVVEMTICLYARICKHPALPLVLFICRGMSHFLAFQEHVQSLLFFVL